MTVGVVSDAGLQTQLSCGGIGVRLLLGITHILENLLEGRHFFIFSHVCGHLKATCFALGTIDSFISYDV